MNIDMNDPAVLAQAAELRAEVDALNLIRDEAPEMLKALQAAEAHFGPFADITINGQHDPDDLRVLALIRAVIAKATGAA